jgi:uncharacterized protein
MRPPLLVNVAELLRRPGTEREYALDVLPADIELVDDRLVEGAPVSVALHLESLSTGIVVDGTVRSAWHGSCRRCLVPVGGELVSEVHELYQLVVTDPDAFPIEHDQLDLVPIVRDVVMIDLPVVPLCRPDCAGLCPTCGVDRNQTPCTCDVAIVDDRWSALDALKDQLS